MTTPILAEVLDYNRLPKDVKTLTVLFLRGVNIELPPLNGIIKFSSLRKLYLHIVCLDQKFIRALCTSCYNLEFLSLHWFEGFAGLELGETLTKLKSVELGFVICPSEFHNVDIRAPNLVDLEMCNLRRDLKVFNITACKTLKFLSLRDVLVTEKWVENLSSLPNLEILYFFKCKKLKTIKFSSVRLKQLLVFDCNLIVVELDTPNLIKFTYKCLTLPTLKLKASVLLLAKISFDSETPDSDWYSKLLEFLGNFSHSRTIELSSKHDEVLIIPNVMRENLLPPHYGTNRLHVKIQNKLKYSVVDIVEIFLWISPQLDILSFYGLKTLEFIHEVVSCEDDQSCCTSLPLKMLEA